MNEENHSEEKAKQKNETGWDDEPVVETKREHSNWRDKSESWNDGNKGENERVRRSSDRNYSETGNDRFGRPNSYNRGNRGHSNNRGRGRYNHSEKSRSFYPRGVNNQFTEVQCNVTETERRYSGKGDVQNYDSQDRNSQNYYQSRSNNKKRNNYYPSGQNYNKFSDKRKHLKDDYPNKNDATNLNPDADPFVPSSSNNLTENVVDIKCDVNTPSIQPPETDKVTKNEVTENDDNWELHCDAQPTNQNNPPSEKEEVSLPVNNINLECEKSEAHKQLNEEETSGFNNFETKKKVTPDRLQGRYNHKKEYDERRISNKSDKVKNEYGKERGGMEYTEYLKKKCAKPDEYFKIVREQFADLMEMPEEYCLAHCVAEDMNMGSGIAVQFRQKFKRVPELLAQSAKQGGVAFIKENDRFVYYLVTKRESNKKPTLDTMFRSLTKMRDHIVENDVKKLAIPRIGCGLDRLEWSDVKFMLEYIFTDTDIEITVCNFQKAEEKMSETKERHVSRKCKIVTVDKPITEIESGTLILYIGSEDGGITQEISALDKKFNMLKRYKEEEKTLGKVFCSYCMSYSYALYCLVIKKRSDDPFNFTYFDACLKEVNKENQKLAKKQENYLYVAMQKIQDRTDDNLNSKIINILRNTLYNVEIYICGT